MSKIRINKVSESGGARSYIIDGVNIPRNVAIKQPPKGTHVVEINGKGYLRSNPDGTKKNNIKK